jgi:hypothetical protein
MTTATRLIDICDLPGAQLDIGMCRWPPDQAAAKLHFLCLLGEVCGRLEEDAAGGYKQRGEAASWLKLSEVDASALAGVVTRMESMRRVYPTWRLNCGDASGIHHKITVHFNTAQALWLREHGQ